MIFSGTSPDGRKHIDLIFSGEKTQTRRRPRGRYKVGKTYAVQAKRTAKADPRGRVLITNVEEEHKRCPMEFSDCWCMGIDEDGAKAEGGYTPEQYEVLYEKMYPGWIARHAYTFEVVP